MLSIVIPVNTYNQWTKEAIESCRRDKEPLEIVIVLSKGLRDKLFEIEGDFPSTETKKMKILVQKESGLAAAMNEGVLASSNDIVARLDSDDLLVAGRLTSQLEFLLANQNYVAVGGQVEVMDMSGNLIRRIYRPNSDFAVREQIVFGNCFTHSAMMFRKNIFLKAGGYDPNSAAEDFDLWSKMITLGKMTNLDVLSCYSRVHENQISIRNSRNIIKSNFQIIRRNILFIDHQITDPNYFYWIPLRTRFLINLKSWAFVHISEARKSNIGTTSGLVRAIGRLVLAFAVWPTSISRYSSARKVQLLDPSS